MTVTELQKQKKELEAHVSELVKKAELKQAELARFKMEVRRLKEEKSEHLDKLVQENECLRRRLNLVQEEECGETKNVSVELDAGGLEG